MWIVEALQRHEDGKPTGIWHLVARSDEGGGTVACCIHDHRSPAEADACEPARERSHRVTGIRPAPAPSVADLARVAFEAYGASTGGKTWDGKPIPAFDDVRARTPHVAAAWEAAVAAVLTAAGVSR